MANHASNIQMVKQLANPIPEKQLVNELEKAYARLVIAENKCIEVIENISQMPVTTVISLHQTLLYEHHDFFIASQHPAGSPVVRSQAEKYQMPGRMWRYGIHSCLELLLERLFVTPFMQDHILGFIYFSYSMVTLLLEQVPDFKGTCFEYLGDLVRYRMAVEDTDVTVRDIWAEVSRYWYNQYLYQRSKPGRIQHHLGVLSRSDTLQRFFYYSKALLSVDPFANARESMIQLFNPILSEPAGGHTLITSFVAAHGVLVNLRQGASREPTMHPAVHASLAFLWCLSLHPAAIQRLEPLVPWLILANYLNTLLQPNIDITKIEAESFPHIDGTPTQQLPEDLLIRRHIWSRLYYPAKFFDQMGVDLDRPLIEEPWTMLPRRHRCLWLGVRIATVCLT
ncbi:hypothetical protein N7522_001451 [Penicillium canescens]|nr:hypothetical protein N7522_001451 [Penicillium canescens]